MPVYRYRFIGPSQAEIQQQVPGSPTLANLAPAIYLDVTVASASKADLDDVMLQMGYTFDSTDPVATPAQQSGADTLSRVTVYNAGTAVGKRAGINFLGPLGGIVDDPTNDKVDVTVVAWGSPSGLTVGGSSSDGTANSVARSDHTHALPSFGTGAGTFCQGNDSRLSDSRTPTGAASGDLTGTYPGPTIAAGAVTDTKVAAANKDGLATVASMRTLGTGAQQACAGNDSRLSNARTPTTHATTHAPGGSDAISTAAPVALTVGGSNAAGTATTLVRSDHVHALPAFGTTSGTFCQGNDSRLSDARTPTAHAASHGSAGSDAITIAESQVTNLTTDLAAKAADNAVVHLTGNETIAGVKTFSSSPVVPTPTASNQAATMGYVDTQISAVSGVYAPGVQSITALRALVSTSLADKQLRLVEDVGAIYRYDTSGAGTDDGDMIITPSDNPTTGRWFKVQAATQNHENLTGLLGGGAGDHQHLTTTQVGYLPASGEKAALAGTSGTPSSTNKYVTNADSRLTDSRTPTAHAATHAPGGTDALTLGTPVAIGTANAAGTATSFVRSDHVHAHGSQTDGTLHAAVIAGGASGFMTGTDKTKLDGIAASATNTPLSSTAPTTVNAGDSAATGTGTTAARADHTHAVNTGAAADLVAVDAAVATGGTSQKLARADHKHTVTTGTPVTLGTANAAGTANSVAKSDHVHAHGAQTDGTLHAAVSGTTNGFMIASDKTKLDGIATGATNTPLSSTTPASVDATAAAVGVGTTAARSDHTHQVNTGTPVTVGTANAAGTANTVAKSDHVHAHGAQTDGTLHALAIANSTAGFLSGTDKAKLDRSAQSVLTWGNMSVSSTTTTRFLTPGYDGSNQAQTSPIQFRVPCLGTLQNLYVRQNVAGGNAQLITYTVRVNGIATAITASVAANGADGNDTTHTVTVSQGDLIDIQVTKAASVGTSPGNIIVSLEILT